MPLLQKITTRSSVTAVKPAAVQKNTVKPAAIEINVRVYYNDYGNHRNNTEETRFSSGRPELKYNEIFRDFFLYICFNICVIYWCL